MSDLSPELLALSARVDNVLARVLPPEDQPPVELHRAMRYAVLGGGKRLRPLLVYASGETFGAPLEHLDAAAAAVEIIHAYSLVHDDLPAMDDDSLRRGRPTCHVAFGEAMAILAGDALQALAFEVLAHDERHEIDANVRVEMLRTLAVACGSHGMAGGQAFDLAAVGTTLSAAELERMHVHKTGALIRASVLMGAACGEPLPENRRSALDHYAKCVGLAFQVVDDILDEEASTEALGKTAGKDKEQGKPTYVSLMGLNPAKKFAQELLDDSLLALKDFDGRANRLRELAEFIVKRDN